MYNVDSQETEPGHDRFEIIIVRNNGDAWYAHNQGDDEPPGSYLGFRHIDLKPYAGEEVQLILNLYQSSAQRPTSAAIDLVMIGEAEGGPSPTPRPLPLRLVIPLIRR
ncbi:MAG TPA: hypothetical protein VER55_16545, partial [Ardenticatenaceae bacterium]|nr:hypothetical protein [Ardenticatenaceae bacterium]